MKNKVKKTNPENLLKIKWMKDLIRKDVKILTSTMLLGVLVSALGLTTAVFSQKLIDNIIPNANTTALIISIILFCGVLFFKLALQYVQRYFGIKQNMDFNLRLTTRFYDNLLRLPKWFFDKYKTGELVARMNDTASIQQTIAFIVNTLILNVLTLIISASFLFIYSVEVGIIALSSLPAFMIISYSFRKKIIKWQISVMESHAKKETNYITTIQNVELIKGANKEDLFSNMNKSIFGFYQQNIFMLGKVGISISIVAEFVGTLFFIVLLCVTSFLAIGKTISIGQFTAILGISAGMLPAIASLAFSNLQLLGARVAFDRMFEFTSLKKEYETVIDEKKDKIDDIKSLKIQNVSFSYEKDTPVLTEVSLEAKRGEIICIFGENGTGKSTILNLVQGFYKPEIGNIFFNDKDINALSILHLRNKLAFVAQQTKLFNSTVIENICMETNPEVTRHAIPLINQLGFDKYFNKLSHGYDTVVHEGGANLSGGQLQLVSFARALYRRPQVLLLDEPTSSMDRETENFIIDLILEYKKNGMVVLVTHKLKPAKISDRIYILKDGIIDSSGNHSQLLKTVNFYSSSFAELID
jgi:ATP-binding cassette, subfamily C, bacteriocin exporter